MTVETTGKLTDSLMPWQQRVIEERDELEGRISRLSPFLLTAAFAALPKYDKELLHRQFELMCAYRYILDARILRFGP